MTPSPVNLTADEVYSPRIVARMNDYDVRIAHTLGEHVWHVHEDTDEFFLVLAGCFNVSLPEPGGRETTVALRQGDTFVVPKGTEQQPSSGGGACALQRYVVRFSQRYVARPPAAPGTTSCDQWPFRQLDGTDRLTRR